MKPVWKDHKKVMLKACRGVEAYLHEFLTFSLHWIRVIILRFWLLFPSGNRPRCILDRWVGTKAELKVTAKRRINAPVGNWNPLPVIAPTRVILLYYAATAQLATLWNSIRRTAAAMLLTSWYGSPPAESQRPRDQPRWGSHSDVTFLSQSSLFQPLDQRTLGNDRRDEVHRDTTHIRWTKHTNGKGGEVQREKDGG
jgi:hypothetical protein